MPRKKAIPTPDDTETKSMDNTGYAQDPENVTAPNGERGEVYDGMIDETSLSDDAPKPDISPDSVVEPGSDETNNIPESAIVSNPVRGLSAPTHPRTPAKPADSILTIVVGGEVETQKDKENTIWHEIKNSHVTGTHLTGVLGKVEQLESGGLIALADYKGQRIAIPIKEMMLGLNRPKGQSEHDFSERESRVLNRMMGAEIDFVVRGITGTGEERAAVASRRAAMMRLRRRYYLTDGTTGKPMVYPGRIVEARVIAVSQLSVRVEIFGVETSIRNWELSWGYMGDARDLYYVGDSVQVRVTSVSGDTPENLRIKADIRSLTVDDTNEKLKALKPQTNCLGTVTAVRNGVVFISLIDGIRAIAHKCYDRRKPGKGDVVLFVVTRIDEEGGVALGIVARIVKRNI